MAATVDSDAVNAASLGMAFKAALTACTAGGMASAPAMVELVDPKIPVADSVVTLTDFTAVYSFLSAVINPAV